jgi:hypothetical protein
MTNSTTDKNPKELHRLAMELADEADSHRRGGDDVSARTTLDKAMELERAAALNTIEEPSRSVLLRSAASLALEAGRLRDAERLVATALCAEPPAMIVEELRDLLEQGRTSSCVHHAQHATSPAPGAADSGTTKGLAVPLAVDVGAGGDLVPE